MTQSQSLKIMLSGSNVFLTGEPGAGKTFTLNKFIKELESGNKKVAITASTGIAASHINGMTIHSWSGLGILEDLTKEDLSRMKKDKRLVKRMIATDILIIDEVSMLSGHMLDMVDSVIRGLRGMDEPFGGMQVILVGDLFQLPPVNRYGTDIDFAYASDAWKGLDLKICYITEQHRQEGSDGLLELLQRMRIGTITDDDHVLLKTRIVARPEGDSVTRLYSHNADVDVINREHLDALAGKMKTYRMIKSGMPYIADKMAKNILAPELLELKVGAEVMFVANNFEEGFVNGTRGKVIAFKDGDPVVQLKNGRKIRTGRHSWKMKEMDQVVAEVEQVPLRLAWAITIHKSQGMSLEAAEVDLTKAFTTGMGYVALSRVCSLEGLYLVGINDMALKMHPEIYALDELLREKSENLITEVKG